MAIQQNSLFSSSALEDFSGALSTRAPDYSIEPKTWRQTAKHVAIFILKIVLFPWALYELAQFILQRFIMLPLYPAQNSFLKWIIPPFSNTSLDISRTQAAKNLLDKGYVVRHVCLEKQGTRYSGLLIGKKETIENGNWVIQATGNCEPVEYSAEEYADNYSKIQYNTLLVNGPGVGRSQGTATPKTMGDAQQVGISFLETLVKAKKIVLAGRSLGGAAIGQAIEQHTFDLNIKYLVVRQMTFDRASNVCSKNICPKSGFLRTLVKKLVRWAGCEMDSTISSKKLADLNIKEVIVQATCEEVIGVPSTHQFQTDGPIINRASLGYRLVKTNTLKEKVFLSLPNAPHVSWSAIALPTAEIASL